MSFIWFYDLYGFIIHGYIYCLFLSLGKNQDRLARKWIYKYCSKELSRLNNHNRLLHENTCAQKNNKINKNKKREKKDA